MCLDQPRIIDPKIFATYLDEEIRFNIPTLKINYILFICTTNLSQNENKMFYKNYWCNTSAWLLQACTLQEMWFIKKS